MPVPPRLRRLALALTVGAALLWGTPGSAAERTPMTAKELAVFVKELEAKPVYELVLHRFDARRGPDDAPVRVVVFSDFQCRPYCARGAVITDELVKTYGDRVQIVFKNYPLHRDCNPGTSTTMHDRACAVALAAQCAHEQDLFWPFHDEIFAADELDENSIGTAARRAGLVMGPWRACLASERPGEQVAAQTEEGKAADLTGTPTWYVNGRKMSGSFAGMVDAVVRYELEQR